MRPKISIVTPSFNHGRFLADAIESVCAQDYPNVEHIVVDGGSTDETLDVLRRYAHLPNLSWVSEPDEGQTDAINKGFLRASGDIVAWLNADDYYLPGALERVADAFAIGPEIDVLYGDAVFVDRERRRIGARRGHAFDTQVLLYYGCYISSTSTFFRRRIIDDGRLLDPSYRVTMDYEYFVRLDRLGYRFSFIPSELASFRWHGENVSSVYSDLRRVERMRVLNGYGFKVVPNERVQNLLYDGAFHLARLKRLALRAQRGIIRTPAA